MGFRSISLRRATLLLLGLWLAMWGPGGPLRAQAAPPGPHGLEVRVQDHRGQALAGAEVELRWLGNEGRAAVLTARTDASGRALFTGLAAGSWELRARHERFMIFVSEVVISGGKPLIVAARQENVRGAIAPLRVRLARGPAPASPVVREKPAPRPTPPPESRPARPQAPPVPAAAPPPPAAPAAVDRGVPKESRPEPVVPEPTPRREPADTAAPSTPAPAVASSPPVPPAPARPPAPRVAQETAHEVRTVRRHADRTCPECPSGESAHSVEREVASGGAAAAGCPGEIRNRFAAAPPAAWVEIAAELPPGCSAIRLELPAGARYTGYRYESGTAAGWVDCPAGRECPGLSSAWLGDPIVVREGDATRLLALFENRAEGPRRARFTAYCREGGR